VAPPVPAAPVAPAPEAAAAVTPPPAADAKSIQTILDDRSKQQPADATSIRARLTPDMQRFMEKVDAIRQRHAEREAAAAASQQGLPPAPQAPAPVAPPAH